MSVIEIKDCTVFRNQAKKALSDFSLQLNEFEHLAILGPNGSGKSTFIAMLMKEIYPICDREKSPQIKILGRSDWSIFELRKLVAWISPKFSENLLIASPLTVIDAVTSAFFGTYGFFADDVASNDQKKSAEEILQLLNLWHLKDNFVEELSSGELRKVLIARAMVLQPKLLLLDEPTTGLDVAAQHDFLNYLKHVADKTTIIMVTHHLEEVIPGLKKVLMIKDGRIFKLGKKEEILTAQNLSELFGIKIALNQLADGSYAMRRI